MQSPTLPEVWLRGPLPAVPSLLQPVAHALLQVREEVRALMAGFPKHLLWERPAGVASPGFHLRHLTGVLDRLRIPSTVLGLLFHAAEHTQRHNGQLLVTVRVLRGEKCPSGNLPVKGGV
ncbi:MAG TPA: hypothetical protein VGM31_18320 [Puia sp.]